MFARTLQKRIATCISDHALLKTSYQLVMMILKRSCSIIKPKV